jgi:membrane carboxypeptidase/penicillin-binding protein PbpC
MVGSANYSDEGGQINMAVEPRQPGSALKPFLYAAAMEHGYTAATPLLDVPTTFETRSGPYSPLNYDRRFHGIVPLRVALASSFNIPAVATLDALGIETFLEMAHRFGLGTLSDSERYGLALTLGGGEVRLTDMVAAYGALANGGELVRPFAVTRVRDSRGQVLYERSSPPPTRVLSPDIAFILTDILATADARVPGFGQESPLDTPFRAAVKTGTTSEFRDNWAIGFTPDRVVGVWVGNTDNRPMRDVSGVDGAGPIWRAVLAVAVQGDPGVWPEPPAGVVQATICSPTGLIPGPDCPSPVHEWFVAGTVPTSRETYFGRSANGELTVNPPPAARPWALEAGLRLTDETAGDAGMTVQILQPSPGSVFYLSPELDSQVLLLKASFPPAAEEVEFRVDGAEAARAPGSSATALWSLAPGTHRVEAIAFLPGGQRAVAQTTFEVRAR